MARPRKFDYDSDDFYDEIMALAMQGLNDAEIADSLDVKFGVSLSPEVFNTMKNGNYAQWSEEENKIRSERLNKVLARGRMKVLGIVRGRYLKTALGGIKTKNKTTQYAKCKCLCEGLKPDCELCGGTGIVVSKDRAIITETEIELAPNMQALATWLYHHDPEWRKVEKKADADVSKSEAEAPRTLTKEEAKELWNKLDDEY